MQSLTAYARYGIISAVMQSNKVSDVMEELKSYQSYLLDMLKSFDLFCKENEIKYFLVGGSVLGAVRHEGFIPWDDDIDLAMFRPEFEKMEQMMKEKNNYLIREREYCYSSVEHQIIPEAPVGHLYYMGKVNKDLSIAPKIDIHPIDGVPNNIILQRIQCFFSIVNYKSTYRLPTKNKGKSANIISSILVKITPKFLFDFYYKISKKIMTLWKIERSSQICSLFGLAGYANEVMPKEYLYPYKLWTFEDNLYPIPAMEQEYLTKLYGDYTKLPAYEERLPKHSGYKRFIEIERRGIQIE